MSFDDAADTLYAGSLSSFVAERKRLAGELRAAGDKAGSAGMSKLGRPGQSAWVVNQLFRQARTEWDALLAATERLRQDDMSAVVAQRAAIATLRGKAIDLLKREGNAAREVVLGRVETNLLALASTGWGPDSPGRLVDDRAPPGFDALAGFAAAASTAAPPSAVEDTELVEPPPAPPPRLVVVPAHPVSGVSRPPSRSAPATAKTRACSSSGRRRPSRGSRLRSLRLSASCVRARRARRLQTRSSRLRAVKLRATPRHARAESSRVSARHSLLVHAISR